MAKKNKPPVNRSTPQATRPAPQARSARSVASPAAGGWFSAQSIRETIEAVAVAFVLAFLFRTFDAEAFVIPTGSMAPTLMGQHKDLLCPQCGYRYQAGASSESEDLAQQRGRAGTAREVVDVTCPMCRYTASVDPRTAAGREDPTFAGDRILVSKFTYDFADPRRWDVTVFKYPGEAQTNYIKRLVGLPREKVRIWHGDIYIQREGETEYHLERRSPAKLRAMTQIVYDNDYVLDSMTEKGWPLRWQVWPADEAAAKGGWTSRDVGRSFTVDGSAADAQWLRYQHFVPTLFDWEAMKDGHLADAGPPRPQLITDFYAYDTSIQRGQPREQPVIVGMHWVGDLLLECELKSSGDGQALFDLVDGGVHFRCELNCADGRAKLSIDGLDDYQPTASTAVKGKGRHRVAFANIDRQLLLWIDGTPVEFDGPTTYEPLANDHPKSTPEDAGDLAPAGIASKSSALTVSHIRLWRDIYYIAADDGPVVDYSPSGRLLRLNYEQLIQFWSTPDLWNPTVGISPFDERREMIFSLAADQFFMLGDNSPMSQDARLWSGEKYVERKLLIGKALYIFWPHSFDKLPGTNIPLPFFPTFARMRFIR